MRPPIPLGQLLLHLDGCRDGDGGCVETRHDPVPRVLDPVASVGLDSPADDPVVLADEVGAGRYEAARSHVERAIDACSSILVLKPWPMAMLAEIEVRAGDLGAAAAGHDGAALDRLVVALDHARRTSRQGYPFHWPVAWVLESLACISARSQPEAARRWAVALNDHALATGMAASRDERTAARSNFSFNLLGKADRSS